MTEEITADQLKDFRENLAQKCCDAIVAEGYSAKVGEDCGVDARVYVSRKLSKGWQNMGYVLIEEDGVANCKAIDRQTASIRSICQSVTGGAV